jgi:hypothetical protein
MSHRRRINSMSCLCVTNERATVNSSSQAFSTCVEKGRDIGDARVNHGGRQLGIRELELRGTQASMRRAMVFSVSNERHHVSSDDVIDEMKVLR